MKQIIAMGAGRINNGKANDLMERYLLAAAGKPRPRICFLPTARGDQESEIEAMLAHLGKLDCQPSVLRLVQPELSDPAGFLLEQDIIYVGGGNTKNMLALWREWGLDQAMFAAYEAGTVLAGWSAGAICWFQAGVTDSIPGDLTALDCLGILQGSCCPHYDSEEERQPSYARLISEGALGPGYAIDDAAALHFLDGKLSKAISSKPGGQAYWVERQGDEIVEKPLSAELLS